MELAYTFALATLGDHGRYRVELPRWGGPVRLARWQLFLPSWFVYREEQGSLAASWEPCGDVSASRIPLQREGVCFTYIRPVLEEVGYVERSYRYPP